MAFAGLLEIIETTLNFTVDSYSMPKSFETEAKKIIKNVCKDADSLRDSEMAKDAQYITKELSRLFDWIVEGQEITWYTNDVAQNFLKRFDSFRANIGYDSELASELNGLSEGYKKKLLTIAEGMEKCRDFIISHYKIKER